jgi:S-DNA-T family DNA segregation ATPase FtsK/SpoIIIE
MRRASMMGLGFTGALRGDRTPTLLVPSLKLSLGAVLVINALRIALHGLGLLATLVLRRPLTSLAVAAVGTAWVRLGPVVLGGAGLVLAGLLAGWRWRWPGSFTGWIGAPASSRWRGWSVYRRHWQPAMVLCGLAKTFQYGEYVPPLRRVRSTRWADSVAVVLLAGQAPEDYEAVTPQLAHTFGALDCRVRVDGPGRIWLDFTRRDPLVQPIPALPVPETPDLTALPLGVTERGAPWLLRLLGTHVLIAGATGAGKGSVLWSLIRALCPAIRDGWVQLWAVDPKGGMELVFGRALFGRFAYKTTADMLGLLRDAVTVMRERQARLLGVTRLHVPSIAEPLIVVLVDELAALTAYTDRDTKKDAAALLQLLLSQGRAVGVLVVAAAQDPGKDVIPFRDLFPTRIALRLLEEEQVAMVLGRGARNRGAFCDLIPETLPGLGFVQVEGVREPVRVRAAYVSDADIAALCQGYAPGRPVVPLTVPSDRLDRPGRLGGDDPAAA